MNSQTSPSHPHPCCLFVSVLSNMPPQEKPLVGTPEIYPCLHHYHSIRAFSLPLQGPGSPIPITLSPNRTHLKSL